MINLGKITKNGKDIILEELENGCIKCISHCADADGYTRICYNGKQERLFRVIYMLEHCPIPKGMLIRHTCDHPYCCNIKHLLIGTHKDNARDMSERGRVNRRKSAIKIRGIKNPSSKLTEEQVKEIYTSNLSNKRLGKLYNVSDSNISLIRNKKQWKWLTDTLD